LKKYRSKGEMSMPFLEAATEVLYYPIHCVYSQSSFLIFDTRAAIIQRVTIESTLLIKMPF
ncbi:MAG: hypothetical protein DSY57_02300, partial [Desulfobulbus sp.]